MKIDELSEQTLNTLLRAPLDVPDEGFTQRLMQRLPAPTPAPRDGLWPAWLFAATGGAWLWLEEGVALTQQWLQTARSLWDSPPPFVGQLTHIDFAAAQGSALWIPVALALVLLVTLMQLVEE